MPKPTMAATVPGFEKHYFYYGQGMQKNQIDTSNKFLSHAGNKHGKSVRYLLVAGSSLVTEVSESLFPKLKNLKDKTDYLACLEFQKKEQHEVGKVDYQKFRSLSRNDFSAVHGLQHATCHVSLRNRMEVETYCQSVITQKRLGVLVLCKLIKNI